MNWTLVGSDTIPMGAAGTPISIGLGVSSHTTTAMATGVFDNVTVTSLGSEG